MVDTTNDGPAGDAADRHSHAKQAAGPGPSIPSGQLDPETWAQIQERVQPFLWTRDIGALFRALGEIGVSQRRIARLTGRSQPNIAEIFHGRRVMSYEVLVAVTRGLGVPPERMGLSWWGPNGAYYGPDGGDTRGKDTDSVTVTRRKELMTRCCAEI